jgi:hypothetical protein
MFRLRATQREKMLQTRVVLLQAREFMATLAYPSNDRDSLRSISIRTSMNSVAIECAARQADLRSLAYPRKIWRYQDLHFPFCVFLYSALFTFQHFAETPHEISSTTSLGVPLTIKRPRNGYIAELNLGDRGSSAEKRFNSPNNIRSVIQIGRECG